MNFLKRLPNKIFILLVRFYRLTLSPSVGFLRFIPFYPKPSCIFYPTCSQYAILCFEKYNFWTAFKKTSHRISKCHPFGEPGVDLP